MNYVKKELSPECPYCYNGEIVIDKLGIIWCEACKKNVRIRKY